MTVVLFDLDNCLSAADEVGARLYDPGFDAIRAASGGAFAEHALAAAFADIWRHPFDWVADRHRFTPAMREAAIGFFTQLEVATPMRGYGDLHLLAQVPATRFLVTSGFRRFQQSKIAALGIAPLFAGVHIDAIDEAGRKGKHGLFQDIITEHSCSPGDVWVVGDSATSELAAARSLGLRAVQTLRPGVSRSEIAHHHVAGLGELVELLESHAA